MARSRMAGTAPRGERTPFRRSNTPVPWLTATSPVGAPTRRVQLGVGDSMTRLAPVRVAASERDFVDVCAGERHSCALRADGSLLCWGENGHARTRRGRFSSHALLPTAVGSRRFVSIACGGENTCALSSSGGLYCWGDNFEGKVGQGDPYNSPDRAVPTQVLPGSCLLRCECRSGACLRGHQGRRPLLLGPQYDRPTRRRQQRRAGADSATRGSGRIRTNKWLPDRVTLARSRAEASCSAGDRILLAASACAHPTATP